jgi:hypothetical protein
MERVVSFKGDMAKFTFDNKGNLVMTLVIAPADKWDALPLTDIRGRRFRFDVFMPPGRAARVREQMAAVPVPGPKGANGGER